MYVLMFQKSKKIKISKNHMFILGHVNANIIIASRNFLIGWIKSFNFFTHNIIENFILIKLLKLNFEQILKSKTSCQFLRLKRVPRQSCYILKSEKGKENILSSKDRA